MTKPKTQPACSSIKYPHHQQRRDCQTTKQVPKRNYAHAISRGTFKDRGQGYSEKGVTMRCARSDQSTLTVTLHYISTGGATLRFSVRKQARQTWHGTGFRITGAGRNDGRVDG